MLFLLHFIFHSNLRVGFFLTMPHCHFLMPFRLGPCFHIYTVLHTNNNPHRALAHLISHYSILALCCSFACFGVTRLIRTLLFCCCCFTFIRVCMFVLYKKKNRATVESSQLLVCFFFGAKVEYLCGFYTANKPRKGITKWYTYC